MSHGENTELPAELNEDEDDRTGLDASPISPLSPQVAPADNAPTEEDAGLENTSDRIWRKRSAHLRDLLTTLDTIIYIELAALYYLDTSTILFVLRSLIQLAQITSILSLSPNQLSVAFHIPGLSSITRAARTTTTGTTLGTTPAVTPATADTTTTTTSTDPILDTTAQPTSTPAIPIPKPATTGKPHVLLILLVNTLALLIHFFSSPPSASEVTRFYLHGSILIDFIGQRAIGGWRATLRLCLLDILVAILQVVAVGVVSCMQQPKDESEDDKTSSHLLDLARANRMFEQERRGARIRATSPNSTRRLGEFRRQKWRQARERGEDIEMQPLRRREGDAEELDDVDDVDEEEQLQEEEEEEEDFYRESSPQSVVDIYYSGQAVVADLNLVQVVKQQFWELRNARLAGRV